MKVDRYLCSMVMLSMSDCLTRCLIWGESLDQWPVIFLRRRTAESWRTLGVLAVRKWWIKAGTTCGSFERRFIWSSAWRLASLSGIRNWISKSSRDCAISLSLFLPLSLCEWGFCFVFKGLWARKVLYLKLNIINIMPVATKKGFS